MLEQWRVFYWFNGEWGIIQVGARDADQAKAMVLGAYRAESI